jgi:hypothetical protein
MTRARDLANILNTTVAKTLVNAKGDIVTATADDTPARVAVGTNGQYLKADSTQSTGLAWGTVTTDARPDIFTVMGA